MRAVALDTLLYDWADRWSTDTFFAERRCWLM
jgi:hypothetical protein